MNKAEKLAEVEFLVGCLTKAQIAFCCDYRGLTVGQVTKLRKDLRKAGANAAVVKNTLGRLSAKKVYEAGSKEAELAKFIGTLKGPSMLIFSDEDPVAPSKAISQFLAVKGNEKFTVKGAWFEGTFVDAAGVEALSKMPGRAETLSMLLRVINAPATQLVRTIQEPGAQLVRLIEAHRQNLEKKAA